jgi:hypothetical protein
MVYLPPAARAVWEIRSQLTECAASAKKGKSQILITSRAVRAMQASSRLLTVMAARYAQSAGTLLQVGQIARGVWIPAA